MMTELTDAEIQCRTKELKERARLYLKEYRQRPEIKERDREYRRRPEVKARSNAAARLRNKIPDRRARETERLKEWRSRPDVKARLKVLRSNPEQMEKERAASRRYYWKNRIDKKHWFKEQDDKISAAKLEAGINP